MKITNIEQTFIHTGAVLGAKSYHATALQVFLLLLTNFYYFHLPKVVLLPGQDCEQTESSKVMDAALPS